MPKARFIEPMLLLRTDKLPDGPQWLHELKFDGYRALAIKSGGKVHRRSRNDKDFNSRYPAIVKALAAMPEDTVIDGEVVALDAKDVYEGHHGCLSVGFSSYSSWRFSWCCPGPSA